MFEQQVLIRKLGDCILKIKKILISQPRPESDKSPYSELEEIHKVTLDFHQFIYIEGVSAKEFRSARINILEHTAVIFNSRTAIDHFFRLCEELRIVVRDLGIGIPETDLERIFLPFYRCENARLISGTGIGLALVKKLLDQMNGKILIRSEIKKGTEVIVYFPLSQEEKMAQN